MVVEGSLARPWSLLTLAPPAPPSWRRANGARSARALHEHLSDAGITTGYVFTGPNGPMTGQAIWKAWKRVARPELDHFAAHQLRNTFANQMVRGGTNLNSVRRLMRHASLVTTQRYLDDNEELERDAVRALDGLTPEDRRPEQVGPRPEPGRRRHPNRPRQ